MEGVFNKPEELRLDGNVESNWHRFHSKFVRYLRITGHKDSSSGDKVAMLLNLIGDDACELYETFTFATGERDNFDIVVQKFLDHCQPKSNILFERFMFYQRNQKEGEPFDAFFTDIKKLSKSCDFGNTVDDMVRDRIVLGTCHLDLQETLLRSNDISLKTIVDKSRAYEVHCERTRQMQAGINQVDAIRRPAKYSAPQRQQQQRTKQQPQQVQCKYCGYSHQKGHCPAFGKKCSKCAKLNHFAKVCQGNDKAVHQLEEEGAGNGIYIDTIRSTGQYDSIESWHQSIVIGDNEAVNFKLDTGADVNIIPLDRSNP